MNTDVFCAHFEVDKSENDNGDGNCHDNEGDCGDDDSVDCDDCDGDYDSGDSVVDGYNDDRDCYSVFY